MAAVCTLPNPFGGDVVADEDIRFGANASIVLGHDRLSFRENPEKTGDTLKEACAPLETFVCSNMRPEVLQVAEGKAS